MTSSPLSRSLTALVRQLHRRPGRERQGLTLAEGIRLVEEALAAGIVPHHVLVSPALETTTRGRALADTLRATGPVVPVSERELDELAATESPQGVLAVIELPARGLEALERAGSLLLLDGVQDPGNAGTMIRTAWALGAAGVIALPGTVELGNPKVLRASMGGLFHLPCVAAPADDVLTWLREQGIPLWASATDGEPVSRPAGPVALAIGNEGAGLTAAVAGAAARTVAVPLRPGAESLNAAVAAAILLYEVLRES